MMLLCWSMLLLCLSAKANDISVYRESGENVTLECSFAGCPNSNEGHDGMYLYQDVKEQKEVLYYHSMSGSTDKITLRMGFKNRTQTHGSLKKHTITISKLTVDDSGVYSCVYTKFPSSKVRCNGYILFIRGVAPCSTTQVPCAPAHQKSPPLVLIIVATCAISMLVTMIFILIVPRVKQWSRRRRTTRVLQVSNDYVYEVMTRNGLPAPEQSSPNPYDFTS